VNLSKLKWVAVAALLALAAATGVYFTQDHWVPVVDKMNAEPTKPEPVKAGPTKAEPRPPSKR
jgi:hypothetical protein